MKKIKMMLMSLALLAVVGGALAFKAKFNAKFCTTAAVLNAQNVKVCPNAPSYCPNLLQASTTTTQNEDAIYCTTTPIVVNNQSTCFVDNQPDQTLNCFQTTKVIRD